jgi:hypothetical protein
MGEWNVEEKFTINEIEDVLDWNVYITPDGFIYPTKPNYCDYYHGSFNCHRDFAEQYCEEILGITDMHQAIKEANSENKYMYGAQDYLIHVKGWVSIGVSNLTGNVYVSVPYNHKTLTEIQKQIAFKFYEHNEFDMKDYYLKFDGILPDEAYDEME